MRTGPHYAQEASGLERAQEPYRSGQLKEAEEAYRDLATKPSGDAAAGLGAILKGSGRKQEAEELYRWALENRPLSVSLLNNACNWLREQGKATESIVAATGITKLARRYSFAMGPGTELAPRRETTTSFRTS